MTWARRIAHAKVVAGETGQAPPPLYEQAAYFLKQFKAQIGLDQAIIVSYGAAPLKPVTVDFFATLDVPLFNLWGLTETSGATVSHRYSYYDLGSCGMANQYVTVVAD